MTYGWNTTKTAAGFRWSVYAHGYQVPTVTLRTGVCATRAQAEGHAKRNVMPYRRGVAA